MNITSQLFRRNALYVFISAAASAAPSHAQDTNRPETSDPARESSTKQVVEEVIVTGVRAAIEQSQDIKRTSSNIVDAITATDIGKLPDATITDSLQRIPGIQVVRSGGEGARVNVRGNGNVMTTLNGEQMISAGAITNVQPDFADIPATMVSGITVLKSPTASTAVGGITGTIDIQTHRPLTMDPGTTLSGKAELSQGSYTQENDPSVAFFAAHNFDNRIAASLNLSYSDSNLADYTVGSTGEDWGFVANENANFALGDAGVDANRDDLYAVQDSTSGLYAVGGSPADAYYAFQGHEATNKIINRERTGVNGSVEWALTDAVKLTGDAFYTDMDEHQYEASFVASQSWQGVTGWFDLQPGGATEHEMIRVDGDEYTVVDGANFASVQDAIWQSRRNMSHTETNWIQKQALNTNLQLAFDNGGPLTASVRYIHGEGKEDSELGVTDGYMNNGSQGGASVKGPGGVELGPANPWGYAGVPGYGYQLSVDDVTGAETWEKQTADYMVIPVGINYRAGQQNWNLPLFTSEGATLYNENGEQALSTDAQSTLYVDDGTGNRIAYDGEPEVMGTNVDRYSLTSTNYSGYFRFAELDAARLDASYTFEFNHLRSVDFGVRAATRDVKQDTWVGVGMHTNGYADPFVARWKDPNTQAPLTGESYIDTIAFNDPRLAGMVTEITDLQGVTGVDSFWTIDPKAMDNPTRFHEQVYGNQAKLADPSLTYNYKETTTNYYFQANFAGDIAASSMTYAANIGVRVVDTEMDIQQTEIATAEYFTLGGQQFLPGPGAPAIAGGQLETNRRYTDVLPVANASIDLTPRHKLRFAYAKNMSNHNANSLAGGVSVTRLIGCDITTSSGEAVFCAVNANANGNPNLDPWRSTNMDVSWEWYLTDLAMVNVGLFQYEIESFPVRSTWEDPNIADSDGVARGWDLETDALTGTVTTTGMVNGDEGGTIEGLELGYQQELNDLVADTPLAGLGWQLNYTYSPSQSGLRDYYGKELAMLDNSEHQYNAVLYYENYGWEARLAYNWRSERFISQRSESPVVLARMAKAVGYLDASVRYSPWESITFSLQATNLTEEHAEEYLQWQDLVDKRYYNERRITLGVQIREVF
ncbi:TonB-dependent receptor [Teredinibacter turnerae]|uniref:TonB-dependent receptor n=1 Tax=Teredinibacter turnerae TaxID=2426 RepID=UPI000425947B|nr:TonB-dependent receptor [Teredinibacter turnerae]